MNWLKKIAKIGLWIVAWPVMVGLKLSKHAHNKIEQPVLKYMAISAIMLPSLFVGTAWGAAIAHPTSPTQTEVQSELTKTSEPTVNSTPKIEKKTETKTEEIPFEEQKTTDSTVAKGQEVVKQEGKNGTKTITFEVTYSDGKETGRVQTKEEVTTPPVPKIVAVGTKVTVAAVTHVSPSPVAPTPTPSPAASNGCDPNYTPCVPIASDVDCAGGSGNGPAYVQGPVKVIGVDKYRLDSDGDGWGCED